jgi:hypothetical protein
MGSHLHDFWEKVKSKVPSANLTLVGDKSHLWALNMPTVKLHPALSRLRVDRRHFRGKL